MVQWGMEIDGPIPNNSYQKLNINNLIKQRKCLEFVSGMAPCFQKCVAKMILAVWAVQAFSNDDENLTI